MPADTSMSTKRRSNKSTPLPDGDHRKRRRNRTTQSCLNCHTTKRMCDRGRPCSRCTQLGLSGVCVYEIDDPARRTDTRDESSRLVSRIAELEGVIRELKNKPHPRWLDTQDVPVSPPGVPVVTPESPLSFNASSPSLAPLEDFPWPDLFNWPSSRSPSDSTCSLSPFSTPLVSPQPYTSLPFAAPIQKKHIMRGSDGPSCRCIEEPACYTVVLELAVALRKTAAVLSHSPGHWMGSHCKLNKRICELDVLTTYVFMFS
ncbi:hypothetical protein C8J57DRAFT_1167579 [Mycena rebaudengoi]|nr:hypothetical protein C8J57DRAFT_1167579 [Mycena rebaudengoi]